MTVALACFWGQAFAAAPLSDKFSFAMSEFDQKLDELFKAHLFYDSRIKIKIGGQSRYRLETRDDFNLNNPAYEDDALNLLRNRLNLDMAYYSETGAQLVKFFAEGQEAHSWAQSDADQTNGFVNELDLRQLFLELKSPWHAAPLTLKVGRQILAYGDERFVGGFDWSNVSRVFDAVKLVYTPHAWVQLDVFASRVVRVDKKKADATPHNDNFYGIYAAVKPFLDHTLDTFLFVRDNTDVSVTGERTGEKGPLKEYTFGNRFKGKKGNLDYGSEYAVQLGSRSHDEIQAWALHQELGYTLAKLLWKPRLYGEYNHASGDRNPHDGKSQTFDNLYPTNHNKYGFMDFVSLKNINDFMAGASVKPHMRLLLSAEFHWFVLDAKESAWFNAGGGNFRTANANADPHLGEELDLLASYKVSEHLSLLGGYSHFFAGPFAKDTGAHDDANFFYIQSVLNF